MHWNTTLALWSRRAWLILVQLFLVGMHMAWFFFPANHFPDSCCLNPVSPTFVSSMTLFAAYIVFMLCVYFPPWSHPLTFCSFSPSFPHNEDFINSVKRLSYLPHLLFFLQVSYFFSEQCAYIQCAEERFLEALNILSLPNASFLFKIHQASSDHIGSVLWGFLDMLCISVSRAIAHTPVELHICHKQSLNTEKLKHCWVWWENCGAQLPHHLELFCVLLAMICHLSLSWREVHLCAFFSS